MLLTFLVPADTSNKIKVVTLHFCSDYRSSVSMCCNWCLEF